MEKPRNFQNVVIIALCAVIVAMSVGFANFTQPLNIAGDVNVEGASWNVKFDDESYNELEGSVAVSDDDLTVTGTSVSYDVTLEKPGDFYEFSIDVKNKGTFDAKLTSVVMTKLEDAQKEYLTYTVSYGSAVFTETTEGLSTLLAKAVDDTAGTETVKVKIAYVQPEDYTKLPSESVKISLSATLNFTQA